MRFSLPITALLAIFVAGCSTPMERFKKKYRKQENARKAETSRTVEDRRMRVLSDSQFSGSKRWAEIAVLDPEKTFDASRSAVGGRTYDAGKARTKEFYFDQKANPGTYRTRDFYGSKAARAGEKSYATAGANTAGQYAIPNAGKMADTKTATTKEAWDAGKTAATKDLFDGNREYRGPESKKARQAIDPATLGEWRVNGESVVNTGNSVEKYSTMKPLTIGDIRELLNKNK